jgi:ketosteroid isomerase-like protein
LGRVLEPFWAEFDDLHVELRELMDAGDHVFAAATVRFRGRGSGVEVGGGGMGAVYTLRDGKIVRYEQFQSKAEALEAAGPHK